MRIAIVNDILIAVEILRRTIQKNPDYEIAWIASNGAEAVEKSIQDPPDLILMDLIMPVMNGVEATRQIMAKAQCAILVVTATVESNVAMVFEAMGYGALDAVNTPILKGHDQIEKGGKALLNKIEKIEKLIDKSNSPPLIVIGSSTGGPKVLAELLCSLPKNFNAAIVIIQHVDAQFASGLAQWLHNQTPLPVRVAHEDCYLEGGVVLLAGTNDHMILTPSLCLKYTSEPVDYPYRPSVNTFFASVAEYWPRKGVGVLLTGIGNDGAQGLLSLRRAGWHTIAQNKESSVVYGMPKAAAELGAAVRVLSLKEIIQDLIDYNNQAL